MKTCDGERTMVIGSAHLPHASLPDEAYEEAILDLDTAMHHGRRVAQFWGVDASTELHSGLDAEPAIGRRISPPSAATLTEREVSLAQTWQSRGCRPSTRCRSGR